MRKSYLPFFLGTFTDYIPTLDPISILLCNENAFHANKLVERLRLLNPTKYESAPQKLLYTTLDLVISDIVRLTNAVLFTHVQVIMRTDEESSTFVCLPVFFY